MSGDGISTLSEIQINQPEEDVIQQLESLLALARVGRIRAFCACGLMEQGKVFETIVAPGQSNLFTLLGTTDMAKESIRQMIIDRVNNEDQNE